MTLIGDNITRLGQYQVCDPARVDLETIRKSFVPTTEALGFCSRVATLVASSASRQPRALLLAGERGTGKTHLVRYLESFLANPSAPECNERRDPLPDPEIQHRRCQTLYINVPDQPDADLAASLLEKVKGGEAVAPSAAESQANDGADLSAMLQKIAADIVSHSIAVVTIDGISRRIARLVDEVRIRSEIEVCRALVEVLSRCGVLCVIVADEEHLRHGPGRSSFAPFGGLTALCDIFRLTRRQIEEVIASALAAKDSAQRAEIQKTLGYLRERLPHFILKPETFTDLYPIHPQAFSILFPLRTALARFSPLEFAKAAIDSACSRSSVHLITHETLFDFVLPELRNCAEIAPILRSFDELCTTAISHLAPSLQAKARALLKGIALDTICDTKPASVTALANALLLYDETQPLTGYSLTAAILMEIEERGRSFLAGKGDGFDRTYRLIGQQMHAVFSATPGHEMQRDDLRVRLPQLIYDWFRAEIPSWRPNPNPKYWRTSLSLIAPIPEGKKRSLGMVYFKNILDPFWSRDDLEILQVSPHPWILLVLSPFEHLYEFKAEIAEIAASSPKIMVWQPDAPTPAEAEQLRRLAVDYPWPPGGAEAEGTEAGRPVGAAHEILTAVYVRRGSFASSQGRWSAGDAIKNQTLPQYLSDRLGALAARSAIAAPPGDEAQEDTLDERYAMESNALKWAALLSGEEDLRDLDLHSAEMRLVSWWLSSQEIDASALAAKLNPLPGILMTTRFWAEYRQFVRQLEMLQPTFQLLHSKSISFCEAMSQVRLNFNRDESVLQHWKTLNLELAGLARWLPALDHMREYLCGAFYTSMDQVDGLRDRLLQSVEQPHQFLSAGSRDAFDRSFLEFKTQYIDCYNAKHEEAMQIAADEKRSKLRIDPWALRNLELLSRLNHADRGHIMRIRVILRWLQSNQCPLPVRQILERSPRCFCSFNPAADSRLGTAANRLNGIIEQGLEYFRTVFRRCREHVIEELKRMRVDQACAQQIGPLLGSGAILPLTPHTIEVLNQVIDKHPQPFIAAFLTRVE